MKKIFNKYLDNYDKGLLLFDAPTGVGKTHASLEYMVDFLKNNKSSKEKIIYITNLKSNLPFLRLKKLLSNDKLFEKECIFLKPYYEMIIDSKETFFIAPEEIKTKKEYKDVCSQIKSIEFANKQLLADQNNRDEAKDYYLKQIEYFQNIVEPKFREFIHINYCKEKNEIVYDWLKKIYTSISLEDKKVIFMSTSRFLAPIDTFDNGVYFLPSKEEIIKKSIIIIDEFDSTKEVLLNYIINSGVKNKINMIEMITSIYSSLNAIDVNKICNDISEEDEELRKKVESTIYKNIENINNFYRRYNLNYVFKQNGLQKRKTFIFNEENKIYTFNKEFLVLETDNDNKENIITKKSLVSKCVEDECVMSLSIFINEIIKRIDYFANGCALLSGDFFKQYNKTLTNDKDRKITYDEAVTSILSYFRFSKSHTEFLYDKIVHSKATKYNENLPSNRSFYERGLSKTIIEDSHSHILDSYMQYYEYYTTPEQIIYNLSNSTFLVGLSATSTIETTIGNYNLEFLENKLSGKLYRLDEDDRDIIRKRLKKKEELFEQGKSKVHIHALNFNEKILIDNDKIVYNELFEKVDNFYAKNNQKQYYSNIIKEIIHCYTYMKNNDIKSMILFLNTFDLNGFSEKDLKELLGNEINIFYVSASDFNYKFNEIKNLLKNGKRVFVYTTYSTIGTGKNIQYEVPMGEIDKFYANLEDSIKKDFESIFLCTPTNLLERIRIDESASFDNTVKSISLALFQIEYLYKNRSLSYDDKEMQINQIFKILNGTKINYSTPKRIDYSFHIAKIIIQAVGRICRTNNKASNIHIFVEQEIINFLSQINLNINNKLFNHEFNSLFSKINKEDVYILENEKNKKCNNYLFSFYKKHQWTQEETVIWKRIREQVLKYPTDNCRRDDNELLFDYYFKFDKECCGYSIIKDHRYNKIIKINPQTNKHISGTNYNVNDCDSKLKALMKFEPLKEYFKKMGYACYFLKNNYIMCDCLYKSVYLGALGEECGKHIIETSMGEEIKLEELPIEHYEKFDYKYKEFYFDFKNWPSFRQNRNEALDKISKKLLEVNGKKAFIINVIAKEGYTHRQCYDERIIEIPSLLIEKENGEVILNFENLDYIYKLLHSD